MTMEALDYKVSVVIPTKNAGHEFSTLLQKLRTQVGLREIEIVIVDSGSTDATRSVARKYGCKITGMKPEGFSHSHSRNVGAARASGDFILFMVQDAMPSGETWAHDLLDALLRLSTQGVVAATCREFPRNDCDLFHGFLMRDYYKFLSWPQGDKITWLEGKDTLSLRKNGALNDVACLIRADVFRKYEYRGVFGEDLDLGGRLLLDGHKLALLSSVKVIHSHYRPAFYYLKRHFVATLPQPGQLVDSPRPPATDPASALTSVYRLFRIMDRLAHKVATVQAGAPSLELWKMIEGELMLELIQVGLGKVSESRRWHILDDRNVISFLRMFRSSSAAPAYLERLILFMIDQCRKAQNDLQPIYPIADETIISEIASLLLKLTAVVCGYSLAGVYIFYKERDPYREFMARMHAVLAKGI